MEKTKRLYSKPDMTLKLFKTEPIMAPGDVVSVTDLKTLPSNVKYSIGSLKLNQ